MPIARLGIVVLIPLTLLPEHVCLPMIVFSGLSVCAFAPDSTFVSVCCNFSCPDAASWLMCCIVNAPDVSSRAHCVHVWLPVMVPSGLSMYAFVPDSTFVSMCCNFSCTDTAPRVMWCIVNAPDATSGLNAYMCAFPQCYIVYFQGSVYVYLSLTPLMSMYCNFHVLAPFPGLCCIVNASDAASRAACGIVHVPDSAIRDCCLQYSCPVTTSRAGGIVVLIPLMLILSTLSGWM